MNRPPIIALAACIAAQFPSTAASSPQAVAPVTAPVGSDKTSKTRLLEAGSRLLQGNAPLAGFDIHLDGFHPMKDQPDVQMEAGITILGRNISKRLQVKDAHAR